MNDYLKYSEMSATALQEKAIVNLYKQIDSVILNYINNITDVNAQQLLYTLQYDIVSVYVKEFEKYQKKIVEIIEKEKNI